MKIEYRNNYDLGVEEARNDLNPEWVAVGPIREDKSDHFETWYEREGRNFKNHKEACRIAWENGAYLQQTK